MSIRRLFSLVLLLIMAMVADGIPAQEPPPPSTAACLPAESPDMRELLAVIRMTVSSDRATAAQMRTRLFEEKKLPPGAVMPVLEEAICSKVVRILKAHLASADSTADATAVVRVDGRYVASFRLRTAGSPRPVRNTYYFDRGFTRVVVQTW